MSRLGIIGTGLIGASVGLAARSREWEVFGYDSTAEGLRGALGCGAIDSAVEQPSAIYATCDVIVIAAHLNATLAEVAALRSRPLRDDQLVIDVASVKEPVARAGAGVGAFVPTHPMAGGEQRGPAAARSDLFRGRTWCYVPTADERRTAAARVFVAKLGAEPVAVDAAQHDRIVALTSHVPQLVAFAFAQCVNERAVQAPELVEALCGPVARELLRLGRSSQPMWDEIFAANAGAVRAELAHLEEVIDDRRIPG
ncbi:MAG TPA: prephenate dehydrogenase/arogenate dehydrogenase family protein [Candidatus Baltobacteraceae bacterium]|nr:prephenate dehydrogenase/arogenate dehydrogenase family protein [Candidatus Baltobacteraceae bacterium]